jgi:hypothetical protein
MEFEKQNTYLTLECELEKGIMILDVMGIHVLGVNFNCIVLDG